MFKKLTLTAVFVFAVLFLSATLAFPYGIIIPQGSVLNLDNSVLVVSGDIINSGTLYATSGSVIKLTGNWSNLGNFIPAALSTVEFIGLSGSMQTINGSSKFYDFKCNVSGLTLSFESGSIQTIEGSTVLYGVAGNNLVLKSTINGTQWKINPKETSRSIYYVDVKDSVNINIMVINPPNSKDSGNNINWWPAGFIQLSISREADTQGSNLIISWDKSIAALVDVYYINGDGSGVFTNDVSKWNLVSNGVEFDTSTYSQNYIKHKNQVGTGSVEAYYKAIYTGYDKNIYLPSSEAVGKFNITVPLYPTQLILSALPVIPLNSDINSVFGKQFGTGNAEVWSFFNAPTSGWRSQFYNGTNWSGSLPSGQTLPDRGYWIKSLTAQKIITLVGSISNVNRSIDFNTETLFLYGNSFPKTVSWESTGLSTVLNANDQVWQWDNAWKSKKYDGSNVWSGTTLPGLLNIHGFWIVKQSKAGTWIYPKPY